MYDDAYLGVYLTLMHSQADQAPAAGHFNEFTYPANRNITGGLWVWLAGSRLVVVTVIELCLLKSTGRHRAYAGGFTVTS